MASSETTRDIENPTTSTPNCSKNHGSINPADNVTWYNPVAVTSWILEALLLKDSTNQSNNKLEKPAKHVPKVYSILGATCAGKESMCRLFEIEYEFTCLRLDKILKTEQESGVSEAATILKAGHRLPSEYVAGLVQQAIQSCQRKSSSSSSSFACSQNFLLCGFPANVKQIEIFEKEVCPIQAAIFLECSDKELAKRFVSKMEAMGIAITDEEVSKKILASGSIVQPVVDYFAEKEKLTCISSDDPFEKSYDSLQKFFHNEGFFKQDSQMKDMINSCPLSALNWIKIIAKNLVEFDDPKYRTLSTNNEKFKSEIGCFSNAMAVLNRFGFQHDPMKGVSIVHGRIDQFLLLGAINTVEKAIENISLS